MKKMFKVKNIFWSLFLFIVVFCIYGVVRSAYAEKSSDAIAIRIISNPEHYSSIRWYQSQGFTGSPQSLEIDDYDAVRDGRTVYVNAANVDYGQPNNDSDDNLYTNIYLISYNQGAEQATEDIFGQILSHWKFNINQNEIGYCNNKDRGVSTVCRIDSDCSPDEYCTSKKSKIIRDVKRLADLVEIKNALNEYKNIHGSFPDLSAGSYLPHKTISSWPSWKKLFEKELNLPMIEDPINKLGDCGDEKFDPITCWDEKTNKFAGDIPKGMPSFSKVYAYYSDGFRYTLCAQLDTSFNNINSFNCFDDTAANNPPSITSAVLNGITKEEFTGYISLADIDGDKLNLSVELMSPNLNEWKNNYQWEWSSGKDNFDVINSSVLWQKKIYAPKAGKANSTGLYKIKATVDDNKGAPNSKISREFDVLIAGKEMSMNNLSQSVAIGENKSFEILGTDASGNNFTELIFDNLIFDNKNFNQFEFNSYGFSLSGMNLNESFSSNQHTGLYKVNVHALDPTMGGKIDSYFNIEVVNQPPVISAFKINYVNGNNENCSLSVGCTFAIDNSEPAPVQILANDPNIGHNISYSLVDNLGGKLSIDSNGLVTGLENLNKNNLNTASFDVSVRVHDQYCSQSSQAECSSTKSFTVVVGKYCSLSNAGSTLHYSDVSNYPISSSGQQFSLGGILSSCSEVGNVSVNVGYKGETRNQEIIFVLDFSPSMEALVNGSKAISQLKSALTSTGGVLDKIYNIAKDLPVSNYIKVGFVVYNKNVNYYPLVNIVASGQLAALKTSINSYATDFDTDTLAALNRAETMFPTNSGADQIVVLMSDGFPGITQKLHTPTCYTPPCDCGGTYPSCIPHPVCGSGQVERNCGCCADCGPYAATLGDCYCLPYSGSGGSGSGGGGGGTPPPPGGSSINTEADFKIAVTTQTKCSSGYPSCNCSYNQVCGYYEQTIYECDTSVDVQTQANNLKNKNIKLYSIYYETGFQSGTSDKMCGWSSDNGVNCGSGEYFVSGTNINTMFNKVLAGIISKPKDVKISNVFVIDHNPLESSSSENSINISGVVNCGNQYLGVDYSGFGSLNISNIKYDYCPAKLHQ